MTLLLDRSLTVSPDSIELSGIVGRYTPDVDAARRLTARVLLHLPRLADEAGGVSVTEAEREVRRLAAQEAAAPAWLRPPRHPPARPTELALTELPADRALVLHERFHYLRSPRAGLHFAGTLDGHVAVVLTFSPLDLGAIGAALPAGIRSDDVLVLSRVYAAAWAPRNTLSRLLAAAARDIRHRDPRPRMLLTYLNPGLGFDGSSYKAANWGLFGREHGTRYAYLDGSYVTDRELTRRFGTSDMPSLESLLGPRIGVSRMPLAPLDLYALALDSKLRVALSERPTSAWARPWS